MANAKSRTHSNTGHRLTLAVGIRSPATQLREAAPAFRFHSRDPRRFRRSCRASPALLDHCIENECSQPCLGDLPVPRLRTLLLYMHNYLAGCVDPTGKTSLEKLSLVLIQRAQCRNRQTRRHLCVDLIHVLPAGSCGARECVADIRPDCRGDLASLHRRVPRFVAYPNDVAMRSSDWKRIVGYRQRGSLSSGLPVAANARAREPPQMNR